MNLSGIAFLISKPARVATGGVVAVLLAASLAGCGAPSTPAETTSPSAAPTVTAPTPTPDSAKAALTAPAADATSTNGTPAAGADTATAKQPVAKPLGKPKAALPVPQPVAATAAAPMLAGLAAPALAPPAPATRTQVGRVLGEAGQPLVGATVLLKGSHTGASTDAEGNYALEVPSGDATFLVGYGGYLDETATTHTSLPLNVTLLPDPDRREQARRRR
ncbi:MAG: carboxypeptidase-like regulatory domain-containing protein [Janthinobacterium lividum]